jgi:hypothetical protein
MIQAHAVPAWDATTAAVPAPVWRPLTGAAGYVARLKAELSIGPDQVDAWSAFADALLANGCRMRGDGDCDDEPFGSLSDRLAALASMRRAAERLFGVLHPAQQRVAAHALPLCCLPRPTALAN